MFQPADICVLDAGTDAATRLLVLDAAIRKPPPCKTTHAVVYQGLPEELVLPALVEYFIL